MPQVVCVIVSSVMFYAVLVWLALSLVSWLARRATDGPTPPQPLAPPK